MAEKITVSGVQSRRKPPMAAGTTGQLPFQAATMAPVLQLFNCGTGSAIARPAGNMSTA